MPVPAYRFNPTDAFPEVPQYRDIRGNAMSQSTTESPNPVAALTLAMAYLLSGQRFTGSIADLTPEEITKEVEAYCATRSINPTRLLDWAESILLPAEATLSAEEMEYGVPKQMIGVGFTLDQYQRDVAAWSATRLGSVQALGCGVGKSSTATAAAIAVAKLGKAQRNRCHIICPVNAAAQWEPYCIDLKTVFRDVGVLSVDSLHHLTGIDRQPGGCLIIDEAHKLKGYDADRTNLAHEIRPAYEWAVCLTGTLLHTGPEGVLSIQDLACPGLSRFMDKWAYGYAFNCVIQKRIKTRNGSILRKSMAPPGAGYYDSFETYLTRSVRSLRFESEEVQKVFKIPEHTKKTIVTFPKTEWYDGLKLPRLSNENKFEWVVSNGLPIDMCMAPVDITAPAVALALMIEKREQHEAKLAALTEEEKQFINLAELRYPGLPTFSEVLHYATKVGWEDVSLEPTDFFVDEKKTIPAKGYRFVRPPNVSKANPAYGPKLLWLQQWLKDNGSEQVVIGAASVDTINLVQAMLMSMYEPYRLIRGGISTKERKQHIEDFQSGKFRVMLLQQVAGSESVTLTKAAYSILVDHDWSPITYTQFYHRTYRRGQTRETTHFDLIYNDTQSAMLARLKRGEQFDRAIRLQIEERVNYSKMVSRFSVASA